MLNIDQSNLQLLSILTNHGRLTLKYCRNQIVRPNVQFENCRSWLANVSTFLQRLLLRMYPTAGVETSRGRNPENGGRRDFGIRGSRQSGVQYIPTDNGHLAWNCFIKTVCLLWTLIISVALNNFVITCRILCMITLSKLMSSDSLIIFWCYI